MNGATDLYYTPGIEEFHVGFEYEFQRNDDDEFPFEESVVKDETQIDDIFKGPYQFRVKYLDHDDIVALGWTQIENDAYQMDIPGASYTLLLFHGKIIAIFFIKGMVFHGIIRNKSELRRLMGQIAIK